VQVTAQGIRASFDSNTLLSVAYVSVADAPRIALAVATTCATYGHEPRLRLDPPSGVTTRRDERLVELIARSFAVRDQLLAMSEADVRALPTTRLRHLERVARLSYLDPSIVDAVLEGTQPRSLSARTLSRMAALPLSWTEQRQVLGFTTA
jgi:site-specific DNA recombinase